ncbi:MAG TPA: response regulator [Phycisphaerales bacterium]|nr:response regulator [Phycisphaerales bacterium]
MATQPQQPLCIVLVDDSADDRALALRELAGEFPEARFIECGDPESLKDEFSRRRFHVMITDFQLRWSDGLKVLATARELRPDAVIVMFTDSGSQEVAVEGMKLGLDDYVLKGARHAARLPLAVRGALSHRAALRKAADLEARYRNLFDRLNVGIYRATIYGELMDANPALLRLLGVRTFDEARASTEFRRILWDHGVPGSLDLIRPVGDRATRRVVLDRAGKQTRYIVHELVSMLDTMLIVDGVVDEERW